MKSATSNVLSKLMDSGRIGCRLADQVRHQREVIQSLNREKTDAVERRKVLEVEVKSLTETNITLVSNQSALNNEIESLKRKLQEQESERRNLQQQNEATKSDIDEFKRQRGDELLHLQRRTQSMKEESEQLSKENISLRMYVSRLEAEVEISRRNASELATARRRDAEIMSQQKARLQDLVRKCSELEDSVNEGLLKLSACEKEKIKTIASIEVALAEKDHSICLLEHSLRIASEEIAAGEKGLSAEHKTLQARMGEKNEVIETLTRTADSQHSRINELSSEIKALSAKYKNSKVLLKQLMETVRSYEATFEVMRQSQTGLGALDEY